MTCTVEKLKGGQGGRPTRTVEEVEQKVYEVETAYSTVLDYTAPYPTHPALFAARPTDSMLVRSIVLHDVC